MGQVIRKLKKRFYNYDAEDYRIEPYCKGECPYCKVEDSGRAYCWGKFKRLADGSCFNGNGAECTKVVWMCFSEKFKLIDFKNPKGRMQ